MKIIFNNTTLAARPWPFSQREVPDGHTVTSFNGPFPPQPWIFTGGALEHVEPAAPVPAVVENWRAKAVLEVRGLLPQVEALINALPGNNGIVVRAAWAAGAPLARDGMTVSALAAQLNLSSEDVDDMFREAAALQY